MSLSSPAWVREVHERLTAKLGYRVPAHRMTAEVVPFVRKRVSTLGLEGAHEWITQHVDRPGDREWQRLVQIVTVGETYFFRHRPQLDAIVAFCREVHERSGRPVEIWSVGCATGEEPYSIALLLRAEGIPHSILATDVDEQVLAVARTGGSYSERSVRHVSPELRSTWMRSDGGGRWRMARPDALSVRFTAHNLVLDPAPRPRVGAWDVVTCRNVLIYFEPQATQEALRRIGGVLAPAGSLWLGPTDLVGPTIGFSRTSTGGQPYLHLASARRPEAPSARETHAAADEASGWSEERLADLIDRNLEQAALQLIEERLRRRPEDAYAHLARGHFHLRDHDFAAALAAYDRARVRDPALPGIDYFRGIVFLKSGRMDAAEGAFRAAALRNPHDWCSRYQLALLHQRAGDHGAEAQRLDETLTLLRAGRSPRFGPASGLVDSVHRDAEAVRRHAGARARTLGEAPERMGKLQ